MVDRDEDLDEIHLQTHRPTCSLHQCHHLQSRCRYSWGRLAENASSAARRARTFRIACLNHEVFDDTMKLDAVIVTVAAKGTVQ